MTLEKFTQIIDGAFPQNVAVEGDKVGVQIDSGVVDINKVLVAFELNKFVIQESINLKVDLIISFHPLIFRSLREISSSERVGSIVTKLIKSSIAYYSVHTSLDTDKEGSNFKLAQMLNLINITPLEDKDNSLGVVGELETELAKEEFVKKVSDLFESNIKLSSDGPKKVKKVAIVAGSGISMLDEVESDSSIDTFITADTKYHDFHRVNGKINLIDPGHFEMEKFNADMIYQRLKTRIGDDIDLILSKVNTNPITHYIWN